MPAVSETMAYWLLRAVQQTPFRGNHNLFANAPAKGAPQAAFSQAELEARNCEEFLGFLGEQLPSLDGRVALDLGSGYGGKTVAMARALNPKRMIGIEPFANMVEKARRYAAAVGAESCEFHVCDERQIPLADCELDVILSHDVIEHVTDPEATIAEMHRTLKSGGIAYIVFTPYWGALAHHLGYVTRLPFIHWLFSPRTLVAAVNRLITAEGNGFGTARQPDPKCGFDGRFEVLPTLNGLGSDAFMKLAQRHGFEVVHSRYPSIAHRYLPRSRVLNALNDGAMRLHPLLREALSFNFVCILRKPPDASDPRQ